MLAVEGVKTVESRCTRGSSSTCPICGFRLKRYLNGLLECERHGLMNRHVVACLNLLRWEGVVRPRPLLKCSYEASPNEAPPEPMRKRRGAKEEKLNIMNKLTEPSLK